MESTYTHSDVLTLGVAEGWAEPETGPARINQEARRAFIAGLRALADFLDARPDLPIQRYGQDITLHTGHDLADGGTWEGARRAVEAFAAATDADLTETSGGHYLASRAFGPVRYQAVAIPPAAMAEHHALMSYQGAVMPDNKLGEVA